MTRRGFTPTAIESLRKLAGRGKTVFEIAGVIGSTAAIVRVKSKTSAASRLAAHRNLLR